MPFFTYHCKSKSSINLHFERQGSISLAGRSGLIVNAAEKRGLFSASKNGQRLTAEQLLKGKGDNHNCIISNVTPKREDELNLMSIEIISCYNHGDWMPLLFHMIQVAGDVKTGGNNFEYKNEQADFIRTFVYLRMNENGVWQWGRTGGVNGPLLWPSAMNFFQREIESIGYETRISV